MKADQELRSLKRGLKVLALLNQIETVGVSELARRLELPRSTAERILMTLASEGYVERLPKDTRYRLSAKVCNLARGFSEDNWIIHVATPLLFDMTKRIGWPLAIATPRGDQMILRVTTDPATSLWLHRRRIGAETPLLGSSSGLVSFACADEVLKNQLIELMKTSKHLVNRQRSADAAMMDALVAPVLEQGYAFQPPPSDSPERSISLPIRINGKFEAVLLMMYIPRALSNATVLRDYLPLLRKLSAKIGERAAHHGEEDEPEDDEMEVDLPPSVSVFGSRGASFGA